MSDEHVDELLFRCEDQKSADGDAIDYKLLVAHCEAAAPNMAGKTSEEEEVPLYSDVPHSALFCRCC